MAALTLVEQRSLLLKYSHVIAIFVLTSISAFAQFKNGNQSIVLDLPLQSQRAIVAQRVGLTDITVTYHRPLVGGRKIWGGIVPYGQVWRAGANEATKVEFSDPVTVEGKPLAKGAYSVHMIPGPDTWTVIFSNDATQWGSFNYDQKEDALRVTVKPQAGAMQEALNYEFDPISADSATLNLKWEKLVVPFKVSVDVNQIALASVRRQLNGLAGFDWTAWNDAARYLLDSKLALDEALGDAERSIRNEERFDNLLTKSEVLEAQNKTAEAAKVRERALEIANPLQVHTYARQLQAQGQAEQAFAIFQTNAKRHPEAWFVHSGLARVYSAHADFPNAAREMRLALSAAPPEQKAYVQGLVQRLEAKQDINK